MAAKDDLLTEISSVLAPGGADVISASDLDDLYEAYVVTALVQAALAEQWAVQLQDINETANATALFRRSPGNIYATPGGQAFTHFSLSKPGVPDLEAHIGIKVTGKSDVEHECDVAVLPKDAARFCRTNRVHPRSTRLLFAAECKYYLGNITLGLGRAFIGLATEMSSQYGECHFVVNTSSPSVMKMLARQKRRRHEDVRPATGRFESLREACRELLHGYYMRLRV
jgi:hypothetical protein